MKRRTIPALRLLPLMAILAVIYPFAFSSPQPAPSPGADSKFLRHAAREKDPTVSPVSELEAGSKQHDARMILSEFFGRPRASQVVSDETDPRDRYALDFLVMTVPDPFDSRLPYLFDRNLSAIQRAAEADEFLLDRFDLPWIEELRKKETAKKEDTLKSEADSEDAYKPHPFEKRPGFILFHDPNPWPTPNGPRARVLLVFLVGETPTTGIHKNALNSALDQIDWLCGYSAAPGTVPPSDFDWSQRRPPGIPAPLDTACGSIKILGPSFSGSAESLDFTLHSWLQSHKQSHAVNFRIVSGSATAIPFNAARDATCASSFQFADGKPFRDFGATVVQDQIALSAMADYLRSHVAAKEFRMAILTEGNTAYGSSLRVPPHSSRRPELRSGTLAPCSPLQVRAGFIDLPFPLHISRLRSESEKSRRERQQSSQQQTPTPDSSLTLPLPTEDDSGDAKDSIPPVSQLDISSSELMLSNILSTISHEQINYVGITATDVRDVIFLAREIREHAPAVVIFTLNADLLYAHPEANPNTRGMLVVTPYPLFSLNQRWMSPQPDKADRIQFPDQASEGIYNAMLHLLGKDELLFEYGSPFGTWNSGEDEVPPLWIVTVGRDGFWPVAIRSFETEDEARYTLPLKSTSPDPNTRTNRGIVPQLTFVVLIFWSVLCLLPALIFLAHDAERWLGWSSAKRFTKWLRIGPFGGKFFVSRGTNVKAYYLIGGTSTLSVYLIAIAAYSVSAIQVRDWGRWLFAAVMFLIFSIGMVACFSLAFDILKQTRNPSINGVERNPSDRWRSLMRSIPVFASSVLCWALAGCLVTRWIWLRFWGHGDGIITGFRALHLRSGVSPLPPLFFMSVAVVFWAFCSVRRLQLNEEIPYIPPCPTRDSSPDLPIQDQSSLYFYSNEFSFRGLRTLEEKVRELLGCPWLEFPGGSRMAVSLSLAMTLLWGSYLFFYRLVYAFEVRSFYLFLGISFLVVSAAVLINVLRLLFLWRALCALLKRLDRLTMRDAFSRFHRAHRTMPRMSLATAPTPLTALGFSVAQARKLINSVQKTPHTQNEEIARFLEKGAEIVQNAERYYAKALEADASGSYPLSLTEQREAQRSLNSFTRTVERVLELSWNSSVSGAKESATGIPEVLRRWFASKPKSSENIESQRTAVTDQAEEFLVSRTVHFLAHVFPQLTNLATYTLLSLFLMVLAVSSYPLQPKSSFSYFNWFLILTFIGVAFHIFIQMNRDVVLSGLNGTKPGEIHWDSEFVGRIVFLIIIPILGLLGVQFPETLGQLVRWFAPAGSGHP